MTLTYAAKDSQVMIARNVRRSLRDPEAFFTALLLPVILMLLFVYVFGGAMKTNGKYVDYVVPGLIVLCAGFGAGTTAVAVATDMTNGIVDRFRSMPIAGCVGPRRPRRRQPGPQPRRHHPRDRRRARRRLAPNRLRARLGRRRGDDRAPDPRAVLARGRGRTARTHTGGGQLALDGAHVPALREHRIRPRAHDAHRAARLRRAPAVHPDHRDDARTVDGAYLDGREHRPRGAHRRRLVHLPPRPLQRTRITPVPTPHGRLTDSRSRRSR